MTNLWWCHRSEGDLAELKLHHLGGLDQEDCLSEPPWRVFLIQHPLHQALPPERITYVALMMMGIDRMKRLDETLLRPHQAMTYTEIMNGRMER